jgi:hypothetical protein
MFCAYGDAREALAAFGEGDAVEPAGEGIRRSRWSPRSRAPEIGQRDTCTWCASRWRRVMVLR